MPAGCEGLSSRLAELPYRSQDWAPLASGVSRLAPVLRLEQSDMADWKPTVPASGERITMQGGQLHVPARPILPFIEGDGTGPDIWRASVRVFDAAVEKAYGSARKI